MTLTAAKLDFRQRGVSIVLVLFLLVVVSLLVLSITRLSSMQTMNSTYTYLSAQSYFAARAGVEWGITHVVNGPGCADGIVTAAGYTVNVTCELAGGPYNEGQPDSYNLYRITATASNGGFAVPDASNRVVTATIRN